MICRLLRNVCLFICQSSMYCIALYFLKLQSFDQKTKHLRHIVWKCGVTADLVICFYKYIIDLHYEHRNCIILFAHINISSCIK